MVSTGTGAGQDSPVIYFLLKFAHVVGATVILGTGSGIAFFMLMVHRSGDAAFIGRTARIVVIADMIFTATAVALQPVTGWLLMRETGLAFSESWIAVSLVLYFIAGAFWLPVVRMQARMRDLALAAAAAGQPLPMEYRRLFRIWFLFGVPGFGAVLAILYLMIAKPVLFWCWRSRSLAPMA
jgi:uncharacterized membrane protein